MGNGFQIIVATAIGIRIPSLLGRQSAELSRLKLVLSPLCLGKGLLASCLVGEVDIVEVIQIERGEEAYFADEASQRTRCVGTSGEAKDEDLILRAPIVCEEVVSLAHILGKAASNST